MVGVGARRGGLPEGTARSRLAPSIPEATACRSGERLKTAGKCQSSWSSHRGQLWEALSLNTVEVLIHSSSRKSPSPYWYCMCVWLGRRDTLPYGIMPTDAGAGPLSTPARQQERLHLARPLRNAETVRTTLLVLEAKSPVPSA